MTSSWDSWECADCTDHDQSNHPFRLRTRANKAPWWWPFRLFKAARKPEEPRPMGWVPWTYDATR